MSACMCAAKWWLTQSSTGLTDRKLCVRRSRASRMSLQQVVIDRDVRAAEAVDALLGIADHEQLSRHERRVPPVRRQRLAAPFVRGQVERDLGLQRVRVLELVDEDALVARLSRVADGRIVAQQVARPRQQIVKRRRPGGAPLAHTAQDEVAQKAEQPGQRRRSMCFERPAHPIVHVLQRVEDHDAGVAAVERLRPALGVHGIGAQFSEAEQRSERLVFGAAPRAAAARSIARTARSG